MGRKFDIGTSLTSKFLAVLEIYHFPTAGGNARLRVSLRETKKHPLKIPKISPKNLGRFARDYWRNE